MSESFKQPQLPGYNFQEQASGLIVAESYRNNATEKHPHPVNMFDTPIPPKKHGLIEREHDVDGKKLIIMEEYPGSEDIKNDKSSNTDTNGSVRGTDKENGNGKSAKNYSNGINTLEARDKRTNGDYDKNNDTTDSADSDVTAEDVSNHIRLEVGHAHRNPNSSNAILRDDTSQKYAVVESVGGDTKTRSGLVASAFHEYYSKNQQKFASVEEAKDAMLKAFESVSDALQGLGYDSTETADFATLVDICSINGKPWAIVGSTDGSRAYRDTDDENLTRLATTPDSPHGGYFEAIPLNDDDRILICSENITQNPAVMREALDYALPTEVANQLINSSDPSKDNSVLVIDVNTTRNKKSVTSDDDKKASQQTNQGASEPPTLVNQSKAPDSQPAVTEVRGPAKKIGLKARATVLATKFFTGEWSGAGKENKHKRTKALAAAALGVFAVYGIYKGGDALRDVIASKEPRPSGDPEETKHTNTVAGGILSKSLANLASRLSEVQEVQSQVAQTASTVAETTAEAWKDTVDPGDGITHTFMDYAQSQGVEISPERSFQLFNEAREAGLINENTISNISRQDVVGGVGFNGPGSTSLSPDILEFLNKELKVK